MANVICLISGHSMALAGTRQPRAANTLPLCIYLLSIALHVTSGKILHLFCISKRYYLSHLVGLRKVWPLLL